MASVEKCTVLITLFLMVHCGEHIVNGVITDVRLVGGPMPDRGTVEIRQDDGSWETTCGVNLGINDVIVICKQLGFTGASRVIQNTPYGQNSTPTSVLNCGGDEANLTECTLISNQMCSSTAGAASCHGEGYLGCFVDRLNDRVFPGDSLFGYPEMTISNCIQFCNRSIVANYVYAGVENGHECFCGEARDNYTRHGVESDVNCQVPCSGDPTESCGGVGYIAAFRIFQSMPPPSTAADTSQTSTTSTTTSTPSTFASTSGQADVKTVSLSTPPPTTVADTSSTFASTSCQVDVKTEIASTLAVGILLAFVTLYGIIITLMYLHLRRSKIALKPSVSDREGQELDPYTSLDATTMKQPAYEDINATRHENRGHTTSIEGVEYGNQRIVEQIARVKKSNLGVANENTEPEYELPIEPSMTQNEL